VGAMSADSPPWSTKPRGVAAKSEMLKKDNEAKDISLLQAGETRMDLMVMVFSLKDDTSCRKPALRGAKLGHSEQLFSSSKREYIGGAKFP